MKEVNKMQRFETQLYQINLKQRDTATITIDTKIYYHIKIVTMLCINGIKTTVWNQNYVAFSETTTKRQSKKFPNSFCYVL